MCMLSITDTGDNFLQFISLLAVFVLVLIVAYFVTRWIASYGQGQMGNKNIRVIEGYRMGPNKTIQIVKVGNKYLVLGVGKDDISYLGEVEEKDLAITDETIKPLPEFKDILAKAKGKIPTKKNKE